MLRSQFNIGGRNIFTFTVFKITFRPPWDDVFEEYHNCDKPFHIIHKYIYN